MDNEYLEIMEYLDSKPVDYVKIDEAVVQNRRNMDIKRLGKDLCYWDRVD